MTNYSYSQISAWNSCQWKWMYSYKMGLIYKSNLAATKGTIIHRVIENILRGREADYDLIVGEEEGEFNPNEYEDITNIMRDCIEVGKTSVKFLDNWETVNINGEPAIEYKIDMPLPNGDRYVGYIDWVAKDPDGKIWLVDFKTRDKFLPDWTEELNLQMSAYQYALYKLGVITTGSVSLQIKSSAPKKPKKNKSGLFSKAKIVSTWETYKATVIEDGQDPNDYLDMQEKLAEVQFFKMSRAFRSIEELERTWDNVVLRSIDNIKKIGDSPARVMSFMKCNMCKFRELCIEDLKGGNIDPIVFQFDRREIT